MVGHSHPQHEEHPLKAAPFSQLSLLDLQSQDSLLAQLRHRKQSLPELATIAELEPAVSALDGERIEAETRVSDLSRAQKKAEIEVEQVRSRRVRDEERLNSGMLSNPKDLESLQHELVALERRIGTLEDEELEVMEALEGAQGELGSVQERLDEARRALEVATASRDTAVAQIDDQIASVTAERDAISHNVPDDLIALYDKVRGQYGGLGAAALRARRCEGCRLELNGADLRELVSQPDDEVLRCPECSRILVRTLESGL